MLFPLKKDNRGIVSFHFYWVSLAVLLVLQTLRIQKYTSEVLQQRWSWGGPPPCIPGRVLPRVNHPQHSGTVRHHPQSMGGQYVDTAPWDVLCLKFWARHWADLWLSLCLLNFKLHDNHQCSMFSRKSTPLTPYEEAFANSSNYI